MTRFHYRVTVPVGILGLIWAVMTVATLMGTFGSPWWIAVAAFVIVVVALARTSSFVQGMARETNDLAATAQTIADIRLPAELGALRAGNHPAEHGSAPLTASAVTESGSAEIREVSAAIVDLHRAALSAAAAEAGLRNGLRQVLVSLGRRNQSLIHRQLRIIDKLEKQASGSAELGDLFALDHLTTRMRRHAESLTVLADEAPGRSWNSPIPVVDVMRAAAAEVEDYKRVLVRSDSDQSVAAPAVTDMIHLLAELIENATLFSPSSTKVEVRAESVANGFVIEIEDRGLGIPADQMRELNARLAEAPDEDLADADRLGLFVAAKLAVRHGVQVSLNPSAYRGTKAVVVLPAGVIVAASQAPRLTGEQASLGSDRLDLQAPGILALAGSEMARRADPVTSGPSVFTPSLESLSSRDPLSSYENYEDLSSRENLSSRDSLSSYERLPGRGSLPRRERVAGDEPPRQDDPLGWDALPSREDPAADARAASELPGATGLPPAAVPRGGGRLSPASGLHDGGGFSLANGIRGAGGLSPASASGGDWFTTRRSAPEDAGFPVNPGVPAGADIPGRTDRPGRTDLPGQADLPGRTRHPEGTGAGADGRTGPSPAKPELPRRVRPERSRPAERQAPPDSPVPDEARSLASSLQSSWRRSQRHDAGPGLANEEES